MAGDSDSLFVGLVLFFGLVLAAVLIVAPNPGLRKLLSIELEIDSAPEDQGRVIPRPRQRREEKGPTKVSPLSVPSSPPPPPSQNRMPDPGSPALASVPGGVPVPVTPGKATGLSMTAADAAMGFMTRQDYLELVKMRVEVFKNYPEQARESGKRGVVVVRFLMGKDGSVTDTRIHQSSGTEILDHSALQAVQNAAPFPRPPGGMFDYPLQLQVAVSFELT